MEQGRNGEERFPLDESAIGVIADLRAQQRAAESAIVAVLQYFARMHELKGQFQLADNQRELIMRPMPQGAPQ